MFGGGATGAGGPIDAVVTAGGRLPPDVAKIFGTDVKAFVRVGPRTMLEAVLCALHGVPAVQRIVVVGPQAAAPDYPEVDEWIDESQSGEENVLAALRAIRTERAIFSASDLPFVAAEHYSALLARTPPNADAGYPIFEREEFLRAYPGARSRFAKLADGEWTGGSAFVLDPRPFLKAPRLVTKGFAARKSLIALASLLGFAALTRFALGRLRVRDIEARACAVLGARVVPVMGCDPALAMDCDAAAELTYAAARLARA